MAGSKRMDDVSDIAKQLMAALPDWVSDARVGVAADARGDISFFITLVVRSGRDDVLVDGEALATARDTVQAVVDASDDALWPYVTFVSQAEAA